MSLTCDGCGNEYPEVCFWDDGCIFCHTMKITKERDQLRQQLDEAQTSIDRGNCEGC